MTQEFIGPGRGPNGAKPHMWPIGINQGTAPGPILPQYTMRQDYPDSWLNRKEVAKAALVYKTKGFVSINNTPVQILQPDPSRVFWMLTTEGSVYTYIGDNSSFTVSSAALIISNSVNFFTIDAERFGQFVTRPFWALDQAGGKNWAVIEILMQPFDPRVTKSLFP